MRRRILIGGGVRSGKSAFALERACQLGERRVLVATARPLDGEMAARIARHRRERCTSFATIEEPLEVVGVLAALGSGAPQVPRAAVATDAERGAPDVAVVDCLTLWLSNLCLRGDVPGRILDRVDALARVLEDPPCHVILVTNEVGFGVVPESELGRVFRDVVGVAHQRLAPLCDELYLGALGVLLRLRPEPVAVLAPSARVA